MTHARLSQPIGSVAALERAHYASRAPGVRACDQRASEELEILDLQCESPERITSKGIETRGNENKVGHEASRSVVDGGLERSDVFGTGQARGLGDVPDCTMRSPIVGCAGPWIPRPLMHRDEMDIRLIFDEGLGAVPVMDVPVDNQNSLETMLPSCIVSRERDISEETESHRPVMNGMMTGRSYGGKAARMHAAYGKIHGCQDAARSRGSGVPGSTARHRISVESPATVFGDLLYRAYVGGVVNELELLDRRVSSFEMVDFVKQSRIIAKRTCDGSQAADVLRMSPSGVVPTTIAMGNERGPHGPSRAILPVAGGGR